MEDEKPYRVGFYTTQKGESPMDEFIDTLPERHVGKIHRWIDLLARLGPDLTRPYADLLSGKIRELRIAMEHHQYRLLYFFHGKHVVITHGFVKKTDKIPQKEIERAQAYRKDWELRKGDLERPRGD